MHDFSKLTKAQLKAYITNMRCGATGLMRRGERTRAAQLRACANAAAAELKARR
jgi:hypothetical protein